MRNCQICGESDRRLIMASYDGKNMSLFECDGCKHRYVDSAQLSQAWFDQYYFNEYKTTDTPYSTERYTALAEFVKAHVNEAIDVGGKNGELHEYFNDFRYQAVGVGDELGTDHECVILSHTLEHVYDIETLIKRIRKALRRDGLLVVEVPVHIVYQAPTEYDYHWQHINKFRPMDLMELLVKFQYSIVEFCKLPDYREYQCWRIAGRL